MCNSLFYVGIMKVDVLSEFKKNITKTKKQVFAKIFLTAFIFVYSVFILKHECTSCSKRLVSCTSKQGFIFLSCLSLVLWFMFRSVTKPHRMT